jgi:hypothetical protein
MSVSGPPLGRAQGTPNRVRKGPPAPAEARLAVHAHRTAPSAWHGLKGVLALGLAGLCGFVAPGQHMLTQEECSHVPRSQLVVA